MSKMWLIFKNFRAMFLFCILLLNISLLGWFIVYGYKPYFHSDSATKVLLAAEALKSGQYFPKDWNYANGDLWVFNGNSFLLAIIPFFGSGYRSHAISGLVSACLLLLGVWLISGLINTKTSNRILVTSVISSGISSSICESLFGQYSYGTLFFQTCFILYFSWKTLLADKKSQKYYGSTLTFFCLLVTWSNPLRALISNFIPLFAAFIFVKIRQEKRQETSFKFLSTLSYISSGIVIGIFLHAFSMNRTNNVNGASNLIWLGPENIVRNLGNVIRSVFMILGGLPSPGQSVQSLNGIYDGFRVLATLAFISITPISLKRALDSHSNSMKLLASFVLALIGSVIFLAVFTSLGGDDRYLIASMIILIVIVVGQRYSFRVNPLLKIAQIFVVVIFASSAIPTFIIPNETLKEWWSGYHRDNPRTSIRDFLISKNLVYGYATYWNAGVITVLSNEAVIVRQVKLLGGVPTPYRWLSSNRWYTTEEYTGKTFLLVDAKEEAYIDWKRVIQSAPIMNEFDFENYKIYVFDHNIASSFYLWDK